MADRRLVGPDRGDSHAEAARSRTMLGVPGPPEVQAVPLRPSVTGGAVPQSRVPTPGEQQRGAIPRAVARPVASPPRGPVDVSGEAKAKSPAAPKD